MAFAEDSVFFALVNAKTCEADRLTGILIFTDVAAGTAVVERGDVCFASVCGILVAVFEIVQASKFARACSTLGRCSARKCGAVHASAIGRTSAMCVISIRIRAYRDTIDEALLCAGICTCALSRFAAEAFGAFLASSVIRAGV